MNPHPVRPYVDALSMNADDVEVYEAVATLEHAGRPATRTEIAAISSLDDQALDTTLSRLTERQVLMRTDPSGEAAYELATRDWSAAPDKPSRSR